MRFSTLLVTALAPAGLFAESVDLGLDPAALDALLAKHNLAIVPRSELTDALTELNSLLRRSQAQQLRTPIYPRQNNKNETGSRPGSGSESDSNSNDSGTFTTQGLG